MKGSSIYWGLLLSGVLLFSILWQIQLNKPAEKISEITPLAERISLFHAPEKGLSAANNIQFLDKTFLLGVTHRHTQKKDKISSFEDSLGAGVCVADFNNDGWDDLFFVTGSGNRRHFGKDIWWQDGLPNQFYLNQQGQYFVNITDEIGIKKSFFGIACAAADLNDDGWIDIIVANKGVNIIYENLGNAQFKLHEQAFANDPALFSTSILINDFNQDGKKDILFGNYVTFIQEQNVLELNAGFNTQKNTNFDPALYDAQPDSLFLGQGNFQFNQDSNLIEPNKHGRSLGFYVKDNRILVLNDKGSPSQTSSIIDSSSSLNSIVINARDAETVRSPDGKYSLLLASDALRGGVYGFSFDEKSVNDRSWDYVINDEHRLHANTWSILTADFNLDGAEDILLANGSLMPHPDTAQTPTGQKNFLLQANAENGQFFEQPQHNTRNLSARGGATLDLNLDGKIDVVIANNNDYPSLLINQSAINTPWIGFKCIPVNQCQDISLTINRATYTKPFEVKQAFASQSAHQFLTDLSSSDDASIDVLLEDDVLFSFTGKNSYFLLDLPNKKASALKRIEQQQKQSINATIEEYIYLLSSDKRPARAIALENQLLDIPDEQKLLLLQAMKVHSNRLYFQLADAWAMDSDKSVALAAINILEILEMEQSIPTLMNLVDAQDSEVSCKAIGAFQFFYWKDEATTERKTWGESPIIRVLDSTNEHKIACAIDALAESESYRALSPLTQQLQHENDFIAMKAVRALGMLRQTEVAEDLKIILLRHSSPFVRAEALVALTRLNVALDDIDLQDIKKQDDPLFNAALIYTLKNSDDGVVVNSSIPSLLNDKIDNRFSLFEHLTTDQLYFIYHKLSERAKNSINPRTEILAQDIFDTIQRYNFSALEKPEVSHLITALDDSQRFQVMQQLTTAQLINLQKNTPSILTNLCKYRDSNISLARCELLKTQRDKKPTDISAEVRQALNSGKYEDAQLLSVIHASSAGYAFAINQLLNDSRLQLTERQFVLENFVLHTENLASVSNHLTEVDESHQLKILRNVQQSIPANTFSSWLNSYASSSDITAITFYAERVIHKNEKESI